MFKRILGMKSRVDLEPSHLENEVSGDVDIKTSSETEKPSLRAQMLAQDGFKEYLGQVLGEKSMSETELPDQQLEVLYETWCEHKAKNTDSSTMVTVGVGIIGALALMPHPAHASIGDEIAKKIIEKIQPFIEKLLGTAMSVIGMDIDNGAAKQAAAIGKTTDAIIEVEKSIYNMEAARDAAPGANECSAPLNAKMTVDAERSATNRAIDQSIKSVELQKKAVSQFSSPAERQDALNRNAIAEVYKSQKITAASTENEKIQAIVEVTKPIDLSGRTKIEPSERETAEAHVKLLFASTESSITIPSRDVNPATRSALLKSAESYSSLQYAKQVINRHVSDNISSEGGESYMSMLNGSVDAEYANEDFRKAYEALTRPAPLLKTMINQQALANKIAIKQLEQSREMTTLLALQLKEIIRTNLT